jgi:hypothetical protein
MRRNEKARNKIADKLLETLDLAKSLDFAANDFRRLRPGSRNLSFRLAQPALRLRRIPARNATQAQFDGRRRRAVALSLDQGPGVLRYGRP